MQRKSRSTLVLGCLLAVAFAGSHARAQASKPPAEPMKMKVCEVAPDFKLNYFDGSNLKEVSLSQYRGKSNVVVAFYIFAFTGG